MASASEPIPIILCGRDPRIAEIVIDILKPEVEVIHLILSIEAGRSQIPLILSGQQQDIPCDSNLPTKNYSRLPTAIAAGAGYNAEALALIMEPARRVRATQWMNADPERTKVAPSAAPEYAKAVGARIKQSVIDFAASGHPDREEVILF